MKQVVTDMVQGTNDADDAMRLLGIMVMQAGLNPTEVFGPQPRPREDFSVLFSTASDFEVDESGRNEYLELLVESGIVFAVPQIVRLVFGPSNSANGKTGGFMVESRASHELPSPHVLFFATEGSIDERGPICDRLAQAGTYTLVSAHGGQACFLDGDVDAFATEVCRIADSLQLTVAGIMRVTLDPNGEAVPDLSEYTATQDKIDAGIFSLSRGATFRGHEYTMYGLPSIFTPLSQAVAAQVRVGPAQSPLHWMRQMVSFMRSEAHQGTNQTVESDARASTQLDLPPEWPEVDAAALESLFAEVPLVVVPIDEGGETFHDARETIDEDGETYHDAQEKLCAPAAAEKGAALELAADTYVRIDGLVGRADLNGRLGLITSAMPNDSGRWAVSVRDFSSTDSRSPTVLIRPQNLTPISKTTGCVQISAAIQRLRQNKEALYVIGQRASPGAPLGRYIESTNEWVLYCDVADYPGYRRLDANTVVIEKGEQHMISRDRLVEAAILNGYHVRHFTGGQVCFEDGDFEKFTTIILKAAAACNIRVGNIFRMREIGPGLRLSDPMILGLRRSGDLMLPSGASFRPLPPKRYDQQIKECGMAFCWGTTRFAPLLTSVRGLGANAAAATA